MSVVEERTDYCPRCNSPVHMLVLNRMPPIYTKHCFCCGWDEHAEKMQQAQLLYDKTFLQNVAQEQEGE